jgi:hypothetical protein
VTGEGRGEVNKTRLFEERIAGADSFFVLRRGLEIGLRRIGTGGDRWFKAPAIQFRGVVFQYVSALWGRTV